MRESERMGIVEEVSDALWTAVPDARARRRYETRNKVYKE